MASDPLVPVLAAALSFLVTFVEDRPANATADDDVKALESVSAFLLDVDDANLARLIAVLPREVALGCGLVNRLEHG